MQTCWATLGAIVAWEVTYQIEKAPEPPWTWESYARLVEEQRLALLDADPPPTEAQIQAFLEEYPCMIPGAFGIGAESGHYPALCGAIRQAPLPSYEKRVPDFLWLSGNSDTDQPVLIEIEAPSKRWFTRGGRPTSALTQALDQLSEWKAWFNVPYHVEAFKAFYGLEEHSWRQRHFEPAYVLIYGRRSEANATPELTRKRANLKPKDVSIMTFDRLQPNPKASYLCCLEARSGRRFRVVSVPPTLEWVPGLARERALSGGWDDAIQSNPLISPARKAFLIKRRPYWENWSRSDGSGATTSWDRE
jgi:hypothetical protein